MPGARSAFGGYPERMGLLDTLRSALGMQHALTVTPADTPVGLTESARAHLASLPDGHGIHVQTALTDRGRIVQVAEGELQGPPPPEVDGPVTMGNADLEHLSGLLLDHTLGGWQVVLALEVRARETPNPNGRLYLCTRQLAVGAPRFFSAGQPQLPHLPSRLLETEGVRSVLLRDNTVTVEREPDHPWPAIDRGVDQALRQHFLLCGKALTGAEAAARQDPLEQAVMEVLEERILPGIHRDGGDLRLLGITDGVVQVAMEGACRTCPASTATLKLGVERALREAFPDDIKRVEQV